MLTSALRLTASLIFLFIATALGYAPRGFAAGCDFESCGCRQAAQFQTRPCGPWHVADSPNFQVCSLVSEAEALRVARYCECLRSQLAATWQGPKTSWAPRCQVVLHATSAAYKAAAGPGSESTLGSSMTAPVRGPVKARRIDLRADVPDILTAALPHELCHLVIADHFRDEPPPLWFDEGVAIQYDPASKRELHERDCQLAFANGTMIPLAQLLDSRVYPPQSQWGSFYGQSASLVRWLLKQQSPPQLLQFAKQLRPHSADRAVHQIYGLPSIDALYRNWRADAAAAAAPQPAGLPLPNPVELAIVGR